VRALFAENKARFARAEQLCYRETWPAALYNHRKWQLIGKSQWLSSSLQPKSQLDPTRLRTVTDKQTDRRRYKNRHIDLQQGTTLPIRATYKGSNLSGAMTVHAPW